MRQAIVAGRFYSGTEQGCREHLKRIDAPPPAEVELPERCVAAMVPHAGWDCSGRVAMRTFRAMESRIDPGATFILLGSVHAFGVARASVYEAGQWETPLGPMTVDGDLAELLLSEADGRLIADRGAHASEHSIEVQLPMIRYVFGDRPILPIAVPPRPESHVVGRELARVAAEHQRPVVFVGTTDLTHYGAMGYQFAPKGPGRSGLDWVKTENDPRMIGLMKDLRAEDAVGEARQHHNACGGGAIAATLGAARQMGSTGGRLIEYTTSYDVLREQIYGDTVGDFVGYAGLVF